MLAPETAPRTSPLTSTIPAWTLATHWGGITVMSGSPSLGLLATGSPSGSRVWETNPAQVAANVCHTLKARFSRPRGANTCPTSRTPRSAISGPAAVTRQSFGKIENH